jgi:hypothetical protein
VNRRFANLCRAADGGFRPNVIPNPSCVRTRARSRAISRPDARSFRKTSREILFATLSTLASEASTYLDVRVRRIAIGALRDGKKSSSSVSRSTGDNLPSGGASRRAFPEWIKRASPTRLERSRESSRHRARARTRAIASRTSARSRCASKIASCSFRIDVTLYRPPRVRLAPSRARASSASSTPSVRSGFTIGAFFSHRARVSYSHCFYAIIPPIARVPSPRGDLEPNLARAPASCPRPDRTDGFRMRPERRVRVVVVARAVVECA